MRQSVALVWRTLRSMRTALILLLLLALASVAGSLIPQYPNSPQRVLQYKAAHHLVGAFYERAGLFDVFGSWWFALITALLFVSLVACLVPRTRAAWRALRQPPIQAREIDAFRHYQELSVTTDPDAAIASARRVLRRRFYRVARDPERRAVAAEKGAAREVGSLLFHWAFILILVGVIYGKGTGFTGLAVIVDGQTWTDALANYDGQIRAGRFFGDDFTGTQIHLRSFESAYRRTGLPMDFVSHVDLLDSQGKLVGHDDIRVNHPAHYAGLTIYQVNFGWAPRLEVRNGGKVVSSGPLTPVLEPAPDGVPAYAMPWHGVLKITSVTPNLAIEYRLYPDGQAAVASLMQHQPLAMLKERDPFMQVTVWRGPILDLSTNTFDPSLMHRVTTADIGIDQTVDLTTGKVVPNGSGQAGLTLGFPDLSRYTVLQVSRDRGVPIVLLAAILILAGLLPALYSSKRKVWVRAEPAAEGTGSLVTIGGFALQRKPQFEEEFAKLAARITAAGGLAGPPVPASDREKVGSR